MPPGQSAVSAERAVRRANVRAVHLRNSTASRSGRLRWRRRLGRLSERPGVFTAMSPHLSHRLPSSHQCLFERRGNMRRDLPEWRTGITGSAVRGRVPFDLRAVSRQCRNRGSRLFRRLHRVDHHRATGLRHGSHCRCVHDGCAGSAGVCAAGRTDCAAGVHAGGADLRGGLPDPNSGDRRPHGDTNDVTPARQRGKRGAPAQGEPDAVRPAAPSVANAALWAATQPDLRLSCRPYLPRFCGGAHRIVNV